MTWARLRELISMTFSDEEVRTLCFDLEFDYDALPGHGKDTRIRELILYCQRRNQTADLLRLLQERRPQADWPAIAPTTSPSKAPTTLPVVAQAEQLLAAPILSLPVLGDLAVQFSHMTTQDEKKRLIRPLGQGFVRGAMTLSTQQADLCAGSPWELDRIALYLFEEATLSPNVTARVRCVEHEFDTLTANDFTGSLVPLHYSIRSLLTLLQQRDRLIPLAQPNLGLLRRMLAMLRARPQVDQTDHVKSNLEQLVEILATSADLPKA